MEPAPLSDEYELVGDEEFTQRWFSPEQNVMNELVFSADHNQGTSSGEAAGSGPGTGYIPGRHRGGPAVSVIREGRMPAGDEANSGAPPPEALVPPPAEESESEVDLNFMLCPITQEPMVDPYLAPDGHSYEYDAVFQWVSQQHSSPMTRAPMTTDQLRPNRALKEAIERWRKMTEAKAKAQEELRRTSKTLAEAKEQLAKTQQELAAEQALLITERLKRWSEKQKTFIPYWQRDETSDSCIRCRSAFGTFRRRHHCRCCGYIFCHQCCSCLAKINGFDALQRICVHCALRSKPSSGAASTRLAIKDRTTSGDGQEPAAGELVLSSEEPYATPAHPLLLPTVVVVPPSWRNFFHLTETNSVVAAAGDATQSWMEFLQSKAPVVRQWAVDTTTHWWHRVRGTQPAPAPANDGGRYIEGGEGPTYRFARDNHGLDAANTTQTSAGDDEWVQCRKPASS